MAGPWEKYGAPKEEEGPWSKYQPPPSEIPQRTLLESAARIPGIVAERTGPYAAAALAGGAVGGPFGAAMGPLALGLSDLAATGINLGAGALGSETRVPAPSDIIRSGMKKVAPSAFVTPETTTEKLIGTGAEAATAALGQANALRMLASRVQPGALQNILAEGGRARGTQVAAAVPAAVASEATSELLNESEVVQDPYARLMLSTAAGLLGGAAGAKLAGAGAVIPNVNRMRAEAKAAYQAVDQSGVSFDPISYGIWLRNIRGKLKSFDPTQHGAVELEIKNLEKVQGRD